jgi:YbbR domain-containing protein
MSQVSRWITSNLGLMTLAFVLALVVWLFNTLQEDPIIEGVVPARVVVNASKDANLVVAGSIPSVVSVNVRAPSSVLRDLQASDKVRVSVDMTALDAGTHVLDLAPRLMVDTATILSSQPITSSVQIERIIEKSFNVRLSTVGTPALGYERSAERVEVSTVMISGTESLLARVNDVVAEVSLDELRSSIAQRVKLQARDANGKVVSGIKVIPEESRVEVVIDQLSNYRTLAVRVKLQGSPAKDYSIEAITQDPQVVTVFGRKEDIQALPGFIETLPVNVDGADALIDTRVGLQVPGGDISLAGDDTTFSVQVRVRIEPQQGARTVSREPDIIGLDNRFEPIVLPKSVDIVLSGPLPVLNKIKENDVRVLIDLSGLGIGVHQVPLSLVKPDNIVAQLRLPTVTVEIKSPSSSLP